MKMDALKFVIFGGTQIDFSDDVKTIYIFKILRQFAIKPSCLIFLF